MLINDNAGYVQLAKITIYDEQSEHIDIEHYLKERASRGRNQCPLS
jgi:hypothetical protein